MFEIGEQCCDGLVDVLAQVANFFVVLGVRVPRLTVAVVDLHETHAAFHESSGQQAPLSKLLGSVIVQAVKRLSRLGLLRDVDRFGDLLLHSIGEVVRIDLVLESTKVGALLEMLFVHRPKQVEDRVLLVGSCLTCRFQVEDRRLASAKLHSLISGWKESIAPTRGAAERFAIAQHNVSWQRSVFTPQSIDYPGANRRIALNRKPGRILKDGSRVIVAVAITRSEQRDVVGMLGRVLKQLTGVHSAFAVLGELEW